IVSLTDCQVAYLDLDVSSTKESMAGGLVGYVETGNQLSISSSGTDVQKTWVKNSTIKGTNNAGGIAGEIRSDFTIADVFVTDTSVLTNINIGGVIGETSYGKTGSITGVTVQDIQTTELTTKNSRNGIGGVIGKNNHTLTLTNVEVNGNTTDAATPVCTITSAENKGRQNAVGGIVGWNKGKIIVSNCSVTNAMIKANSTRDYENDINSAGGIIGYSEAEVFINGPVTTENLTIAAPFNKNSTRTNYWAAGGIIGYMTSTLKSESGYASGLSATVNTITGKLAGGLIGCQNGGEFRLTGVKVESGTISSDYHAGGFIGELMGYGTGALNDLNVTTDNLVNNMTITGGTAGGAIGEANHGSSMRFNCVKLNACTIKGSIQNNQAGNAGGVIGSLTGAGELKIYDTVMANSTIAIKTDSDTLNTNEQNSSAGGMIGSVSQSRTGTVYVDNTELIGNQIGFQQKDSDKVQLVAYQGTILTNGYKLTDTPAESGNKRHILTKEAADTYGYNVGTLIGTEQSAGTQIYIMQPTISFAEAKNCPVVDVGHRIGTESYAYRKNCHILYAAGNAAMDNSATATAAYMKTERDKAEEVGAAADTRDTLWNSYRLGEAEIAAFDKAYVPLYVYNDTSSINKPFFIYKPENGTMQEVLTPLADIMTNVAGTPASDMSILQVSAKAMEWNTVDKTGSEPTNSATPSIKVNKPAGSNDWQFSYQNFDGLTEDGKLTYTELTFTYQWSERIGNESRVHQKVYKLPVFVEEIVTADVHARIMSGKETSVKTIHETGLTGKICMANDSDYTLLLEYVYGNARKNQGDAVCDKNIYLQEGEAGGAETSKKLVEGTRLLLIDTTASHTNTPYYYTVGAGGMDKIPFTKFKDSSGKAYENQPISKLSDVTDSDVVDYYTDLQGNQIKNAGVEQYLLMVLKPENAEKRKEIYSIHSDLVVESDLDAKMIKENYVDLSITSIPGLSIELVDDKTKIAGTISKEGLVTADMTFSLTADSLYWTERKGSTNLIDSANYAKYLELAVYLRDTGTGGGRIRFPSGTNYSYRRADGTYSEPKTIPDTSVFYYYKDIGSSYPITAIESNQEISTELKFYFAGADLSELQKEAYVGCIDLLRTVNKDYPMGNNNKLDSYTGQITASSVSSLGFAIQPEDYLTLGINTYPAADASNTIPFKCYLDFSKILEQLTDTERENILEKWAGYEYEVTYQIYEKKKAADGSTSYVTYTGNKIMIQSKTGESYEPLTDNKITYTLTKEEIEKNVIAKELALQVEAADLDLANYKIAAALQVKVPGDTGEGTQNTTDFFIFTVTRLKTDL
ncbi:MAG: hypothetical protein PHS74_10550, partial [Lachnospiraceae bacterium]|nr:hypothetical protein [Lachnospiraceae bacterium]